MWSQEASNSQTEFPHKHINDVELQNQFLVSQHGAINKAQEKQNSRPEQCRLNKTYSKRDVNVQGSTGSMLL